MRRLRREMRQLRHETSLLRGVTSLEGCDVRGGAEYS